MISNAVTLILVTVFGGLIFYGLERKTALSLSAQYITFMQGLNATLSCVASTAGACAGLTPANGTAMYASLISSYMQDPTQLNDPWSPMGSSVYLFAFTIVSTIGYGTFAPKTPGGQIFTIFYALVTIPVGGVALGKVAGTLLELGEWFLYMLLSGRIRTAFKESNRSGDGVLDYDDMRLAISKAQGHEIDPGDFNDAVAEYDPFETHEISHATFTAIYLKVDKEEMQDVRATDRAKVCSLMVIGWLALGMFFFAAAEGWSNVESMYFGVVTLTTIGFGDYFPNTPRGVGFHFLFCIFGLGLVATLLGALSALAAGGGGGDDEEEEEEADKGSDGGDDDKPAKKKGDASTKKGGDDNDEADDAPPPKKKGAKHSVAEEEEDVPAPHRRVRRSSLMNPPPTGLAGQAMMQEGARHPQHQQQPVRRPVRRPPPAAAPAPAPPAPAQQGGMPFGLPGIPGLDPAALFSWVPGQQQQQAPLPVVPTPQPSSSDRPVQRRPVQRRPPVEEEEEANGDEEAPPPPQPAPRRKQRIPNDEL